MAKLLVVRVARILDIFEGAAEILAQVVCRHPIEGWNWQSGATAKSPRSPSGRHPKMGPSKKTDRYG
jgi:hypothetical protein